MSTDDKSSVGRRSIEGNATLRLAAAGGAVRDGGRSSARRSLRNLIDAVIAGNDLGTRPPFLLWPSTVAKEGDTHDDPVPAPHHGRLSDDVHHLKHERRVASKHDNVDVAEGRVAALRLESIVPPPLNELLTWRIATAEGRQTYD